MCVLPLPVVQGLCEEGTAILVHLLRDEGRMSTRWTHKHVVSVVTYCTTTPQPAQPGTDVE